MGGIDTIVNAILQSTWAFLISLWELFRRYTSSDQIALITSE